jgi:hypothetical protein
VLAELAAGEAVLRVAALRVVLFTTGAAGADASVAGEPPESGPLVVLSLSFGLSSSM